MIRIFPPLRTSVQNAAGKNITLSVWIILLLFFLFMPPQKIAAKTSSISAGIVTNGGTGYTMTNMAAQMDFVCGWNANEIFASVQISPEKISVAGKFCRYFFSRNYINSGAEITFHLDWFSDIAFENNICASLCWKFGSPCSFECLLNISYFIKTQVIWAIRNYVPYLTNYSPAFSLVFSQKLLHGFSVCLGVESFETHRYPLFLTPSFFSGISFRLTDSITTKLRATARYTDFFSLTAYLDFVSVNISLICRLGEH